MKHTKIVSQGRPKDDTLPRQRGFAMLNANKTGKRAEMLKQMQSELNIGRSYAENIHGEWRKALRDSGELKTVYTIKDNKHGQPVEPYVVQKTVFEVKPNDCTTMEDAKKEYTALMVKNAGIVAMFK